MIAQIKFTTVSIALMNQSVFMANRRRNMLKRNDFPNCPRTKKKKERERKKANIAGLYSQLRAECSG